MRVRLSTLLLLIVVLLVGLITSALLFLQSDYASRRLCQNLQEQLAATLGAEISLHACGIGLVPPALEIQGLEIRRPGGPEEISINFLRLELNSLALLIGRLSLERVYLANPRVHLVWLADGRLRWPSLPPASAGDKGASTSFWPEQIDVQQARVLLEIEQGPRLEFDSLGLVVEGRPDNNIHLALVGRDGQLQLGRLSEQLRDFHLEVDARPGQVHLKTLTGDTPTASLEMKGRVEYQKPAKDMASWLRENLRPSIELKVKTTGEKLAEWLGVAAFGQGEITIAARSHFTPDRGPWLEGRLQVEKWRAGKLQHLSLSSAFELDATRFSWSEMTLQTPAGDLRGNGRLDFQTGKLPFEAELKLEELRAEQLAASLGVIVPAVAAVSGKIALTGRLQGKSGPSVVARVELKLPQARINGAAGPAKLPPTAIKGTLSWKGERWQGEKIDLLSGQSQIRGGFDWKPGGQWRAELWAETLDLEDIAPLLGLEISGRGKLEAHAESDRGIKALLSVDMQTVVVEKRPLGTVKGSLRVEESVARLDNLLLRGPGGTVVINGRVGLASPHSLGLLVDLSRTDLAGTLSVVTGGPTPSWISGWIGGQMQVAGNLQDPTIDFQIAVGEALVGGQPVPEAGLVGRLHGGAWHLELLQARLGNGWLYAQGDLNAEGQVDISLFSTGLKADSFYCFSALGDRLDFRLDLNLSLKGALRSPVVNGWAKFYDTRWEGRSLGDSLVNASASTREVNLEGRLLGRTLVFAAKLLPQEGLPLTADFKLEADNLADLLPAAAAAVVTQAGFFGEAALEGSLGRPESWRARLHGKKFWLNLGGMHIEAPGGIVARLSEGRLELEPLSLRGSGLELVLSGGAGLKEGPRFALGGQIDLGSLVRLLPGMTRVAGTARLQTRLEGTWELARPLGELEFEARGIEMRAWPDPITELRGRLLMDAAGLEVVSLAGLMGDGSFSGLGRVEWAAGRPLRLSLGFDVDGVRTRVTQNIWGRASGVLQLSKEPTSRLRLSGSLQLKEGGYREKLTLASLSQGLFRRRLQAARVYSTQREALDFDLELMLPERFRVEYDLNLIRFSADLHGALKVTGTNERLGLQGELAGEEGTVNYLTKDFSLQEARVKFVDAFSILPEVKLSAQRNETVVRSAEEGGTVEYRLSLELEARGDEQPKLKLSSDPALDERDVVALLSLGVVARDLETLRGEDLVGLGGEILSRSLQFDEKLGRLFPFPPQVIQPRYLRVRSGYSTSGGAQRTGAVSPRLEVGAKLKLISDALDVDYSRSLYDDTDQNLDFTYRLSRRVSARLRWQGGEKDTPLLNVGDLGLDLRLRWEW